MIKPLKWHLGNECRCLIGLLYIHPAQQILKLSIRHPELRCASSWYRLETVERYAAWLDLAIVLPLSAIASSI